MSAEFHALVIPDAEESGHPLDDTHDGTGWTHLPDDITRVIAGMLTPDELNAAAGADRASFCALRSQSALRRRASRWACARRLRVLLPAASVVASLLGAMGFLVLFDGSCEHRRSSRTGSLLVVASAATSLVLVALLHALRRTFPVRWEEGFFGSALSEYFPLPSSAAAKRRLDAVLAWCAVSAFATVSLWVLAVPWSVEAGIALWCANLALSLVALPGGGGGSSIRLKRLVAAAYLLLMLASLALAGGASVIVPTASSAAALGAVFLLLLAVAAFHLFHDCCCSRNPDGIGCDPALDCLLPAVFICGILACWSLAVVPQYSPCFCCDCAVVSAGASSSSDWLSVTEASSALLLQRRRESGAPWSLRVVATEDRNCTTAAALEYDGPPAPAAVVVLLCDYGQLPACVARLVNGTGARRVVGVSAYDWATPHSEARHDRSRRVLADFHRRFDALLPDERQRVPVWVNRASSAAWGLVRAAARSNPADLTAPLDVAFRRDVLEGKVWCLTGVYLALWCVGCGITLTRTIIKATKF